MSVWTERRPGVAWSRVLTTVLIVLLSASCVLQGVKLNRLTHQVAGQRAQIESLEQTTIDRAEMDQIMRLIGKHMNRLNDRLHQVELDDVMRDSG